MQDCALSASKEIVVIERLRLRTLWRAAIAIALIGAAVGSAGHASDGTVVFAGRLLTEDGRPIAGAQVILFNGSHGLGETTDEAGAYSFSIAPGIYELAVRDWESSTPQMPSQWELTYEGVDVSADRDLAMVVPLSLAALRVVTPEALRLPGARLRPHGGQMVDDLPPLFPGGPSGHGYSSLSDEGIVTNDAGEATLPFLTGTAEIPVVVSPPEGSGLAKHAVRIQSAGDSLTETVAPYPARFSGTLSDSFGTQLAGVEVTLSDIVQEHTTTDPTGRFSLEVAPGTYSLSLSSQGASGLFNVSYPGVDVTQDTTRDLALQMRRATVNVVSPHNEPVAGASVLVGHAYEGSWTSPPLYDGGLEGSTWGVAGWAATDEHGRATVPLLASNGAFRVEASPPEGSGWVYAHHLTGLIDDSEFTASVQLRPGHVVSGVITTLDGDPVEAPVVGLFAGRDYFPGGSNAAGEFSVRTAPGQYSFFVRSGDPGEPVWPAINDFWLSYDDAIDVTTDRHLDLVLPVRRLRVRVLDEQDQPVEGATVRHNAYVTEAPSPFDGGPVGEGHSYTETVTDAEGIATVTSVVGSGTAELYVSAPEGRNLSRYRVELPANGEDALVRLDDPSTLDRYIAVLQDPLPNENGWNNSDVTLSFDCFDRWSTVVECAEPVTFTSEGIHTHTAASLNARGERDSVTTWVQIDKTSPVITAVPEGAPHAGWYRSAVTVNFACADFLSGVAVCPEPAVIQGEGRDLAATGTVYDRAGNEAVGALAVNIDGTAPETTLATGTATRTLGGTVSDALSGPEGVTVTLRSLLTGAVSTHRAMVSCMPDATTCTWSLTPTGTPPGAYAVSAAGLDVAGNIDATPAATTLLLL